MTILSPKHNYAILIDCLFLITLTTLSAILYVHKVGFYTDDWGTLYTFASSTDQSLLGFIKSYNDDWVRMRPGEAIYQAVFYWLFGAKALNCHIANNIVFISGIILFYLALRQLGQKRLLCLSIPVVFAFLPHYSTNRIWIQASYINMSMTLYFASIYSDLRALQGNNISIFGWKLLSIITMIWSVLSYEVFVPFFLLNPLLTWYRRRQLSESMTMNIIGSLELIFLGLTSILILSIVIIFKAITTLQATELGFVDQIIWFKNTLTEAFVIGYGIYGLGLPIVFFKIIRSYFDFTILMSGLTTGVIVFVYLYHEFVNLEYEVPSLYKMSFSVIAGVLLFILGYAIFLTNQNILNTLAGISNRIAIAGSVGVAISMVGAIGILGYLIREKFWRNILFFLMISTACTIGFIINNTIASFWTKAYIKERDVLEKIRVNFPHLPKGSTIMLDGICPYIGPAIVFESYWDLADALRMTYRYDSVAADVVKPNLTIGKDGITTVIYNVYKNHYAYENLYVYNYNSNSAYPINNESEARNYFETISPNYNHKCPEGVEGYGVPVFWNELHKNWETWNEKN